MIDKIPREWYFYSSSQFGGTMAQSWWPQDFWMKKTIRPADFKSAFSRALPEGKIQNEICIDDYPNLILFQLLVPEESRESLNEFLVDFCYDHGYKLEIMPYNGEPEPGVLPIKSGISAALIQGSRRS